MSTQNKPYFLDQYGHVYRWQKTESGEKSVTVATFQTFGTRAESQRLVDLANLAEQTLSALREVSPEITRLNEAAWYTVFNPAATQMVRSALKLTGSTGGYGYAAD